MRHHREHLSNPITRVVNIEQSLFYLYIREANDIFALASRVSASNLTASPETVKRRVVRLHLVRMTSGRSKWAYSEEMGVHIDNLDRCSPFQLQVSGTPDIIGSRLLVQF